MISFSLSHTCTHDIFLSLSHTRTHIISFSLSLPSLTKARKLYLSPYQTHTHIFLSLSLTHTHTLTLYLSISLSVTHTRTLSLFLYLKHAVGFFSLSFKSNVLFLLFSLIHTLSGSLFLTQKHKPFLSFCLHRHCHLTFLSVFPPCKLHSFVCLYFSFTYCLALSVCLFYHMKTNFLCHSLSQCPSNLHYLSLFSLCLSNNFSFFVYLSLSYFFFFSV
jgi:hypothetical protein